MVRLTILMMVLVNFSHAEEEDSTLKVLKLETINGSSPQAQIITLTKQKLALEIENRELKTKLSDLTKVHSETTLEKKDLEKELRTTEKELQQAEKRNEALEQKNMELASILEKIKSALQLVK